MANPTRAKNGGRPFVASIAPLVVFLAIATTGIERVDFLGGHGQFRLIPSVIALSLSLLAIIFYAIKRRGLDLSRIEIIGCSLIGVIAVISLVSLFTNRPDIISFGRWGLFLIAMGGTWAAVLLGKRIGAQRAIRNGAFTGLAIYAIFDLLQLVAASCSSQCLPTSGFLTVSVTPLGDELIRLTGSSLDPNRATVLLAFLIFIAIQDRWTAGKLPRWLVWTVACAGGVMAIATWSRSGLIAFTLIVVGTGIQRAWENGARRRLATILIATVGACIVALVALVLIAPDFVNYIVRTRLTLTSGNSAESHVSFYGLAGDVLAADPMALLRGIGFGQSYRVIEHVMPSMGMYGNFHSLYLTFLVETGVAGLLAIVLLLVLPLRRGRLWLGLGAILFGLFYQGLSDPTFWLQLAVLWVFPVVAPSKQKEVKPHLLGETLKP